MKKALSIALITLTCLSIFGCSNKKCITLSNGTEFCVVKVDNCKEFYTNQVLHRVDGPAVICENGYKEWWIEGEQVSEVEFEFLSQLLAILKQMPH